MFSNNSSDHRRRRRRSDKILASVYPHLFLYNMCLVRSQAMNKSSAVETDESRAINDGQYKHFEWIKAANATQNR